MKEEDVLPATVNQKKENSDSVLFGRGRYKFWAFAALMLLAFWSMFKYERKGLGKKLQEDSTQAQQQVAEAVI
ncbi:unnamed protein product [Eruca vesicaria subsp. sativa]|uniref:Uncharacterized protein n=1 Tax=Eruca vesicaria subsp. sativa TaxID=29727 RepID=A0ABC8JWK5_ERUVS|nr:unnamed protein product [Eruca vesicaria subsp. sativa]